MYCLLKPNQYSAWMAYTDVTTDGWNRLIANPRVLPSKDAAPLLIWGRMCDTVEIDPESNRPRCIGDNVDKMYALQIDVDGGYPISWFERDYSKYSYQLYTSYSHTFKEGGDRYRVIFPLAEPLYVRHLVRPVKDILHDFAPMVDMTCYDKGHWQIIPCIRAKDAPYEYRQHDGKRLSFRSDNFAKIAEEYSEVAEARRSFADADRDPNSNHQGALDFVQRIFDDAKEGERNRTMYAKLMWLRDGVGCTATEVLALRPPAGSEDEYAKMVQRLF